jgi:hypothetical protein
MRCEHPRVIKYIDRIYFDTVEEAVEYAQLYIAQALEITK